MAIIKKQYIVRKYVMATSAAHALRLEKKYKPEDCWVDDDWLKRNEDTSRKTGFNYEKEN